MDLNYVSLEHDIKECILFLKLLCQFNIYIIKIYNYLNCDYHMSITKINILI